MGTNDDDKRPKRKKRLSSHRPQAPEFRTSEHELHGVKEVGLAAAVPPHDAVHFRGEGMDLRLLLERPEVRERDGFDVHGWAG